MPLPDEFVLFSDIVPVFGLKIPIVGRVVEGRAELRNKSIVCATIERGIKGANAGC